MKITTIKGLNASARARLLGKPPVPLSKAEARKNLLYGTAPDRDEKWPLGKVDENPVAKAIVESTERVREVK
jgi:hypothetical protein